MDEILSSTKLTKWTCSDICSLQFTYICYVICGPVNPTKIEVQWQYWSSINTTVYLLHYSFCLIVIKVRGQTQSIIQGGYLIVSHKSFSQSNGKETHPSRELFLHTSGPKVQFTGKSQTKPTKITADAGNGPCYHTHIPYI
jgi:hypothetical protein